MDEVKICSPKYNIHDPIEISVDNIEIRDILERRHLAERIIKRLGEVDCPSVMGIYGGWGTGKTSLVNLLDYYNKKTEGQRLCFLNIDAWKYDSADGLLIPIVVKLKELTDNANLPEVWKVLVRRAAFATVTSLSDSLLGTFGLGASQIIDRYDKAAARDEDSYQTILQRWELRNDDVEETNRAFGKLVGHVVQKQGGKTLVICVDNLDRCSPENVIRLLESVKVFFSTSGCIWLFAIDSDVVAGYINKKYQDIGIDGYSYLDKIIPEQYHLSLSPALDEKVILALIRHAVGGGHYQIDTSKIPQIPKLLVPRRLIKSARKFADYYKSRFATRGVPSEIVMGLSFLYHTWPGFYQRLSSGSKKHIRGILDNFFDLKDGVSSNMDSQQKNIPLSEDFIKDKELIYFIQTMFSGYTAGSSEKFINEIVNGMEGLREGGLP